MMLKKIIIHSRSRFRHIPAVHSWYNSKEMSRITLTRYRSIDLFLSESTARTRSRKNDLKINKFASIINSLWSTHLTRYCTRRNIMWL